MIARKLTLALSILALSAGGNAFAAEMNFLAPHSVELLKILPPPPAPNSEAQKQDMADVMEVQKNRTPEIVKRAEADNVLSIWRYDDVLGPNFKAASLPVFDAFMKTMHADARTLLSQTKDAWKRVRPPAVNSEVVQLGGPTRLPYGYPSGTTFGHLTAIVLANMVPEKSFDLYERSVEYSNNRVVLGVHYPRDAVAGAQAAAVAAQAFFNTPAFVKEYEPARDELRRVLGYPPAKKSIDDAIASGTLGATPPSSNPPK
jgi:acid phosphatase (class A)